ncbi:putative DNA-binding domain-containing protein [Catenovulum sp. SM1970]|uniref:HvfC family RiPP maturation protein n=1 Tax=Marinifaba aquimaris TaxID=2741323 RepID=UPI001572377C|nr:putative DNA-binding domain-containing protein [Marinifaba aquimaris]NTS75260.1 putative DNA-binding domain-containing protein [Marinifaba aquimaris]
MNKTLSEQQKLFTQNVRNPEEMPLPEGIEQRRMAIYQELFFNNIDGFLSSGFPVLKSLYTQSQWQQRVRAFFIEHQSESPLFLDISAEFVEYLSNKYQYTEDDPIFMLELAHYEWVELVVGTKIEKAYYKPVDEHAVDASELVLSEFAWPLSYQFPVHQISSEYLPDKAPSEPTHLIVYRSFDDNVEFMLVNAATIQLVATIEQNPAIQLATLVEKLLAVMPNFSKEQISPGVIDILNGLAKRGIIRQFHHLQLS